MEGSEDELLERSLTKRPTECYPPDAKRRPTLLYPAPLSLIFESSSPHHNAPVRPHSPRLNSIGHGSSRPFDATP